MLDRSKLEVNLGPAIATGVTVRWKPVLYLRPDFERWLAWSWRERARADAGEWKPTALGGCGKFGTLVSGARPKF